MRTVKLVVIGTSGVGKTSLRNQVCRPISASGLSGSYSPSIVLQYISGRFTTGYRATIGADFITKTVPHHSDPAETVTLQIWVSYSHDLYRAASCDNQT